MAGPAAGPDRVAVCDWLSCTLYTTSPHHQHCPPGPPADRHWLSPYIMSPLTLTELSFIGKLCLYLKLRWLLSSLSYVYKLLDNWSLLNIIFSLIYKGICQLPDRLLHVIVWYIKLSWSQLKSKLEHVDLGFWHWTALDSVAAKPWERSAVQSRHQLSTI